MISASSEENLQPFKDKMTSFLEIAEKQLNAEKDNLTECQNKFIKTMKFYQFSPKSGPLEDCQPKDFFGLWSQFCIDFKDIWKKEEQRIIKEKYYFITDMYIFKYLLYINNIYVFRIKEVKRQQDERISKIQKEPKKEGGLKARFDKLKKKS